MIVTLLLGIGYKSEPRGITKWGRSTNYKVGQKDYHSGQGLQIGAQTLRGVTENKWLNYRDYKFIIKVT